MLRLTPEELETVKDIIYSVIPGYEVRAFGSRVAGVLDWARISPEFKNVIEKRYEVIQKK